MQNLGHYLAAVGLFVITVVGIYACSGSNIPDDPRDIVSNAYHVMSKEEDYQMHGALTIVIRTCGKDKEYRMDVTAVSRETPREITVQFKKTQDGKEMPDTYLYYDEELDEEHSFLLAGGCWTYEALDTISTYWYVLPFEPYFSNIKSFRKLAQADGVIVLKGSVDAGKSVYALKESGALEHFSLTSLADEDAEKLPLIGVTARVEEKTGRIIKAEVDMTDTVRKLATLFYGENNAASPVIKSCTYEIDSVNTNHAEEMPLPKEAGETLRKALKES